MANLAKQRLELLLQIMEANNWSRYSFPQMKPQRHVRIHLLFTGGFELFNKEIVTTRMPPHNCWINARSLVACDSSLVYWEGVIANADSAWPTPHAWAMRKDIVVDATVDAAQFDYYGAPMEVWEGVHRTEDTIEQQMERFLAQYKGCAHTGSCQGLPCDEKMQAFLKWVAKGERQ